MIVFHNVALVSGPKPQGKSKRPPRNESILRPAVTCGCQFDVSGRVGGLHLEIMKSRKEPAVFLPALAGRGCAAVQAALECALFLRRKPKRYVGTRRWVRWFTRNGGDRSSRIDRP